MQLNSLTHSLTHAHSGGWTAKEMMERNKVRGKKSDKLSLSAAQANSRSRTISEMRADLHAIGTEQLEDMPTQVVVQHVLELNAEEAEVG